MNENLTEIACILDRSGSMESIRNDAIGGFNTFLAAQQAEPGEARFTLILFDNQYERILDTVPLGSVKPLDTTTFVPRGSTALLDAIGRTMDDLGKRLAATPEDDRPAKVVIAILTDGYENASHRYTHAKIAQMIAHQREKYAWEFIFLAANEDAIATATSLSMPADHAIAWNASAEGVQEAFLAMSLHTSALRKPKR